MYSTQKLGNHRACRCPSVWRYKAISRMSITLSNLFQVDFPLPLANLQWIKATQGTETIIKIYVIYTSQHDNIHKMKNTTSCHESLLFNENAPRVIIDELIIFVICPTFWELTHRLQSTDVSDFCNGIPYIIRNYFALVAYREFGIFCFDNWLGWMNMNECNRRCTVVQCNVRPYGGMDLGQH